jgi:hypothetical protein
VVCRWKDSERDCYLSHHRALTRAILDILSPQRSPGELILTVMGGLHEFERKLVRQRTWGIQSAGMTGFKGGGGSYEPAPRQVFAIYLAHREWSITPAQLEPLGLLAQKLSQIVDGTPKLLGASTIVSGKEVVCSTIRIRMQGALRSI